MFASNKNAIKQGMSCRLKGLFSRTIFMFFFPQYDISMRKLKKLKNAVIYILKLKFFK